MTRRAAVRFTVAAALAATALAAVSAWGAVSLIESRALSGVRETLSPTDDWVDLSVNGTVLRVSGEAPDPAAQIAALSRIGRASGWLTVIDDTAAAPPPDAPDVAPMAIAPPPRLEILRDGKAVTLLGSVPAPELEDGQFSRLPELGPEAEISPILQPAGPEAPEGWGESVKLGLTALPLLEKVRIVVDPGTVTVTGSATSAEARQAAIDALNAAQTPGVELNVEIAAPRPVIAPFVFRAEWPAEGHIDIRACTAETEVGRARIVKAVEALGGIAECRIGLGSPSPKWADAVAAGLKALGDLGGGVLSVSDADMRLEGPQGFDPVTFSAAVRSLSSQLPEVFSLTAGLPPAPQEKAPEDSTRPARFTATRTAEGTAKIGGDLTDAQMRVAAETFAEAQFGFDSVANETAVRQGLPSGWSSRVMGGLEAMGLLTQGKLEVGPDRVALTGIAPSQEAAKRAGEILAERLPEGVEGSLKLDVHVPDPAESAVRVPGKLCAEQVALILDDNQIQFPPSESDIAEESLPVLDRIAQILGQCPGARFEIGGHTDSQGRESSNMALSQARADAVLSALLERGVDTVFLYARGYGEEQPIASNETEEGRARNRRIEFRLLPETEGSEGDAAEASGSDAEAGVEATRAANGPEEAVTTTTAPEDAGDAATAEDAGDAEADAPAEDEAAPGDATSPDEATPEDAASPDETVSEENAAPAETEGGAPRPQLRPDEIKGN